MKAATLTLPTNKNDSKAILERSRPDREAVKVLALAVGVRESARRMGIPEATVQAWSARGKWFEDIPKPQPPTVSKPNGATSATRTPGQALQDTLRAKQGSVRLNLAKYCENGSKVAAKSRKPLSDAPLVDKLANVMSKVWPEQTTGNQSGPLSLNVLCGNAAIQVNNSESEP